MIKLAFLLFGVLQGCLSAPSSDAPSETTTQASTKIAEDGVVQQLIKALPIKEMKEIGLKHYETDPGYQAAILYLKSPEWEKIVSDVRNNPEWAAFKHFLKTIGVDLNPIIDHLTHCINATNVSSIGLEQTHPTLNRFMADFRTNFAIPIMKAVNLVASKVSTDENLKKRLEQVASPQAKELFEKVRSQPAFQTLLKKLKEMDVQVEGLIELFYGFVGWKLADNASTPRP